MRWFSVATCFFDSARLLCVAIICQFYDPKSGSVLIGRFLRFLQDEMLFASFCPIPSVGDAVYFPGQSARPLTELNIRRTEGKIWCHYVCVCFCSFWLISCISYVLLQVPEHGAVFDHGLLTYRMHRCTAVAPFPVKIQPISISSVPAPQDARWWRKQVGFVGQEPILFDASVLDNVS